MIAISTTALPATIGNPRPLSNGYQTPNPVGLNITTTYLTYETIALANLSVSGMTFVDCMAPELPCAMTVMTADAAENAKNGTFSRTSFQMAGGETDSTRLKGQISSSTNTNGRVTTIGFAASPATNSPSVMR